MNGKTRRMASSVVLKPGPAPGGRRRGIVQMEAAMTGALKPGVGWMAGGDGSLSEAMEEERGREDVRAGKGTVR